VRRAGTGQLLTDRLVDDLLDDALDLLDLSDDLAGGDCRRRGGTGLSCSTSSTVTSSGMLTVLEMAPEMNGCTAPIILTWPL